MAKLLLGTSPASAGPLPLRSSDLPSFAAASPTASKIITRHVTVDFDADPVNRQKQRLLEKRRDRRNKQREHKLAREAFEQRELMESLLSQSKGLLLGLEHQPSPQEPRTPAFPYDSAPAYAGISSSPALGYPMYVTPSQDFSDAMSRGAAGADQACRTAGRKQCRCCGKLVRKPQVSPIGEEVYISL
eukprot:TRINITY_DN13885_c0_g1_i1.p1 TRINITY_DN13885_c0_g1~~TRINITY_DN13885_c0_g1_i1.p1  ORF type:complete len:188 (-),score=32.83 TRINITY_DN13885_c0_g1_i1:726-1289(-)